MSRVIWKFPIDPMTEVLLPADFIVRHVGLDPVTHRPPLWIELDPNMPTSPEVFIWVGTGHDVPPEGIFLGTAITSSLFVWHIYHIP